MSGISLDLQSVALQNAWAAYRHNPNDQNAKNDIWRLTREIHKLDPTLPLVPPPD